MARKAKKRSNDPQHVFHRGMMIRWRRTPGINYMKESYGKGPFVVVRVGIVFYVVSSKKKQKRHMTHGVWARARRGTRTFPVADWWIEPIPA
jgi:hypothetical protein